MRRTARTLAIGVIAMGTAAVAAGCGGSSTGGPGTEPDSQVCAAVVAIDKSEPTISSQPTNANRLKAASELHDFSVRIKAAAAKAASSKLHSIIDAVSIDFAEYSTLVSTKNTTGITAIQTKIQDDSKALTSACPGLSGG